MRALENGTKRKKPGYPTPRNTTLVEDHPAPDLLVRDQLLCYLSHYHFYICHSQMSLIITKRAHITDMKAARAIPYFTEPRTSSTVRHIPISVSKRVKKMCI